MAAGKAGEHGSVSFTRSGASIDCPAASSLLAAGESAGVLMPSGFLPVLEEQLSSETRGQWYVRQIMGSANLDGGELFHLMSGNLSFQIEHHLFPDLPSNRYRELAVPVRALCEEFGISYTSGRLSRQYLQVLRRINRLALPPRNH